MIAIENANIVLEHGILWNGVLVVEDDRIVAVDRPEDIRIPE